MAATDPELKDKFPLPMWMKSKPTQEFEPFATSPPPPEDSFFFIKYPNTDIILNKQKEQEFKNISLDKAKNFVPEKFNPSENDWSKHTKPCQEVLFSVPPINTAVNSAKPKSAGIDDGFTGEGAACGTSVVKVAQQMISSNRTSRGFTVATPEEDNERMSQRLATRRGSKSLPVTPAHSPPTSPNSRRKHHANRYFTSPFEPATDNSNRSWLATALLGLKKELATSTSTLAEEDGVETRLQGVSLAESVENLGPAPKMREAKQYNSEANSSKNVQPASQAYRPKPSELREMNFWSPTSM